MKNILYKTYKIKWYEFHKKWHIKHIYGFNDTKLEWYIRIFMIWLFSGNMKYDSLNNESRPFTYNEYKQKYL